MGTNESSKEQAPLEQRRMDGQNNASSVQSPARDHIETSESNEYFEQYKMKEEGIKSVNAWSDFYDTEDLLDVYLEKQGYPFEEHPELKESNEYFEQYKMKEQGTRSVNAWSDFYDTEDLLDVYLEKQGYPMNHDIKKEKSAA